MMTDSITKADAPWLARPVGTWIGFASIGGGFIIGMASTPLPKPGILDVILGFALGWTAEKLAAPLVLAYLRQWALAIKSGQIWTQLVGPELGSAGVVGTRLLIGLSWVLGVLVTYAASYALRQAIPGSGWPWTSGLGPDWNLAPESCCMVAFFLLLVLRHRGWYQSLPDEGE
jgi:hypothetical protein